MYLKKFNKVKVLKIKRGLFLKFLNQKPIVKEKKKNISRLVLRKYFLRVKETKKIRKYRLELNRKKKIRAKRGRKAEAVFTEKTKVIKII